MKTPRSGLPEVGGRERVDGRRREIFVFGSNLAGVHGAGSALHAHENCGALYGIGVGLTGNSYAIPTKDYRLRPMHLAAINLYIKQFIDFARYHSEWRFTVVKIGCGLAGFREEQIKPLFRDAPENCILPEGWRDA